MKKTKITTITYGYGSDGDIVVTCLKHPRYKALRKPTARCKTCREIYEAKHQK